MVGVVVENPQFWLAYAARQVLEESLVWTAFFHVIYWCLRLVVPFTFDTFGQLERDKKGYWCSSVVSTVHGTFITVLSMRALYEDPHLAGGSDFFHTTSLSETCLRAFFGYILADLLLAIWYRKRWPGWVENMIHHFSIMVTWGIMIYCGCGHTVALTAHICELTTPFVNQRWFLAEAGLKGGKVYFYNGIAMTFFWFWTRIVMYLYCGTHLWATRVDMFSLGYLAGGLITMCFFLGFLLQVFWFDKMVRGALKQLQSYKEKAE